MMDPRSLEGREVVIDVGGGVISKEEDSSSDDILSEKYMELNRIWSGYMSTDEAVSSGGGFPNSLSIPVANEELLGDSRFGDKENAARSEKSKKNCKKAPKPPRPPKAPSLDAAEVKLVREISELAVLKRARIERMKALKKMKNAKVTSSNSNLWALIVTILFCFVIFWQGNRGSVEMMYWRLVFSWPVAVFHHM